jgi:5-formyltetrahydrofolate cyclo-ligase
VTGRAVLAEKTRWRSRLLAARRALPADVHAARAAALAASAVRLAAVTGGPVCAYVPVGSEPGSVELVTALHAAGHEVLLPVVTGPSALDWAAYTGPDSLVAGPLGLREPVGPRLGADAIARARLVLLPHYDRTLPLAAPDVPLVIVLNDEELVDELPAEPHDRRVTGALLADAGHVTLGNNTRH